MELRISPVGACNHKCINHVLLNASRVFHFCVVVIVQQVSDRLVVKINVKAKGSTVTEVVPRVPSLIRMIGLDMVFINSGVVTGRMWLRLWDILERFFMPHIVWRMIPRSSGFTVFIWKEVFVGAVLGIVVVHVGFVDAFPALHIVMFVSPHPSVFQVSTPRTPTGVVSL